MRPERALRFLDALDSLAFAACTACAGYYGQRLATLTVAIGLLFAACFAVALP